MDTTSSAFAAPGKATATTRPDDGPWWHQQCEGALPGQLLTEAELTQELSRAADLGQAIEGDPQSGAICWFSQNRRFTYIRLTAEQANRWRSKWGRGW